VSRDPYRVLGLSPSVSAEELHDAYRRLVKLHHPDRNGGSAESTARFQEIQEAYEQVRELRARGASRGRGRAAPPPPPRARPARDAAVEDRMAALERELREAKAARDRAVKAARDAVRDATGSRPSDEELGYVNTDDSFGKILADVRSEVSDRLAEAREHPAVRRVADVIDGLEGLTSRFDRR
jgi:curved DNA-binding protein CbpA